MSISKSSKIVLDAPAKQAVEKMRADGRRVEVFGEMKNGKLELHTDALDAISRKSPDGRFVFVAVNAPFDPVAQAA